MGGVGGRPWATESLTISMICMKAVGAVSNNAALSLVDVRTEGLMGAALCEDEETFHELYCAVFELFDQEFDGVSQNGEVGTYMTCPIFNAHIQEVWPNQ